MARWPSIRITNRLLFTCLFALVINGCDSSSSNEVREIDLSVTISDEELKSRQQYPYSTDGNTFYFGFDLRASPQEDAAQYKPFLDYLNRTTGYNFKLRFTPNNSSSIDELGQNNTQFAALGAASFLIAQQQYGVIPMVRGLNNLNRAEYRSMLVVSPNSPVDKIQDIKGSRLAFGSIDSTQGHLIPRIMLSENGIELDELAGFEYTGSHQNCAEAVVTNRADVCGMQDQMAENLEQQGLVRIVHQSKYYPSSGIAANHLVPKDVVNKVSKALLEFEPKGKDKEGLYNWHKTEMENGFIIAKPEDYDDLKKWMQAFGFM